MKFWVWLLLIFTILTILAGGIVRTTHSGMGCPDWPKCFGQWVPPTNESQLPADFEKYLRKQDIDHSFNAFHTWVEYINRLLATLLGALSIIQLFIVWRNKNRSKAPLNLARLFLFIIIVTGLFGALVVRYNLQHYSISVHMALALITLGIQVALCTHCYNRYNKFSITALFKNLLLVFTVLLICHVALGTGVRMYIDDVSFALQYQQREKWLENLPNIFLIHRSFNWLILGMLAYIVFLAAKTKSMLKPVFVLTGFIFCEITIGLVMAYLNIPAWAQPVHVTISACIIAQALYINFSTKKN